MLDSSLTSNTNLILYDIRIRRNRARTSASPGYADHPEDERISLSLPSLALTNHSSSGDLLLLLLSPGCPQLPEIQNIIYYHRLD